MIACKTDLFSKQSKIEELYKDGHITMTVLVAPKWAVKWHGTTLGG